MAGSQFDFAHTSQKSSVGHAYQLFHDQADQDGVGDNHISLYVYLVVML